MLEELIASILPVIISLIELVGIFVVAWSTFSAFWECLQNVLFHKNYATQFHLANGLAMGLEFKMAAEILKTVLVQELRELLILGAVILLRALLSLLIHFELRATRNEAQAEEAAKLP